MLASVNGLDWSGEGVQFPPANIQLLFYRDGQFVAFGSGGQIGFSPDGKAWNDVSLGLPTNLRAVVEGNDRVVAAGNSGLIMSSDPLPEFALTLDLLGDGTVKTNPVGRMFKQGTSVTLTAVPTAGNAFFGWSGGASGSVNPLTITIGADVAITATFQSALTGFALWQVSEFNSAERANVNISGPNADPDGDGRGNLVEYLGGTLPKSADAPSVATASTAKLGSPVYPVLTYTRKKGRTDVTDRVEVSSDLSNWRFNGDGSNQTYTTIFNLIDGPDDTEIVSVRGLSAIEPTAGKVFLRLSVTMP